MSMNAKGCVSLFTAAALFLSSGPTLGAATHMLRNSGRAAVELARETEFGCSSSAPQGSLCGVWTSGLTVNGRSGIGVEGGSGLASFDPSEFYVRKVSTSNDDRTGADLPFDDRTINSYISPEEMSRLHDRTSEFEPDDVVGGGYGPWNGWWVLGVLVIVGGLVVIDQNDDEHR